eukprot:8772084-Alexandrium_andersonii.AAC.1
MLERHQPRRPFRPSELRSTGRGGSRNGLGIGPRNVRGARSARSFALIPNLTTKGASGASDGFPQGVPRGFRGVPMGGA